MGALDEKVVVVTGGGRGIGRACSLALAREGAKVCVGYGHREEPAAATAAEIVELGGEAFAFGCDVANPSAPAAIVDAVKERWGRLDVLVNNAGITKDNLLLAMSDEQWDDVLAVNLSGAARMARAVLRPMLRARAGSIVNVSSVAGQRPNRGQSNYAASKGGLEALTRALAGEMGKKGIRVNAVAPGVVVTEMTATIRDAAGDEITDQIALRRFATPEEIASAVVFLAGPASSYITGAVIPVDGGFRLG